MFKLNRSHLNQTVLNNIVKACRQAQKNNYPAYIKNRKGFNFIRVDYLKGYMLNGKYIKGGFQITDGSHTNIAKHIAALSYDPRNEVKHFIKSSMMFTYQVNIQARHSV